MNTFQITNSGDTVALVINQPTGPDIKGIVEETAPGRYFHISGTGTGTTHPNLNSRLEIDGRFSAGFGWGTNVLRDNEHVGCPPGGTSTFKFVPTAAGFPPPGVAHSLQRLEIIGPAAMAPGESAQFGATGYFTDGSISDISARVEWHTPFPQALQITKSGFATAKAFGEAPITAFTAVPNYHVDISAKREVIVVPPNTFRVAGRVSAGTPPQAVVDADVTVTSGPAADLSARTGWDGSYALYGVSGATEIRVSKAGYPSQLRSVAVQSHQTLDITLPAVAFPNVSGTYTMTLTADLGCSSPMDPPLNIRTYSANIVQSGRDLTVTLGGASFLVLENRGNGFPGTVDPEQVTFSLDDNNHFDIGSNPDVVELVGGLRVQMLFGKITTGITSNRLSGVLSGSITRADRAPLGGFFWGASCESSSHQVVFSR